MNKIKYFIKNFLQENLPCISKYFDDDDDDDNISDLIEKNDVFIIKKYNNKTFYLIGSESIKI